MKKIMLLLTFILTISCFGNFSILAASSSDGCIEIINDVADLKLENNEFLLNFNNKKVLVKTMISIIMMVVMSMILFI